LEKVLSEESIQELLFPLEGLNRDHFKMALRRKDSFESFFQILSKIQGWLKASLKLPPDELVLFLAERIELEGKKLAVAQNLALEFTRLLRQNPAWKLDQLTAELPSIRDNIKKFAETLNEMEGFEASSEMVNLTTLHKAKGMEWDTVFVGGITSGQFQHSSDDYFRGEKHYLNNEIKNPIASARAELEFLLNEEKEIDPDKKARQENIAERVRLIYVAVTRAKENLFLSSHLKDRNWDRRPAYIFKSIEKYIKKLD